MTDEELYVDFPKMDDTFDAGLAEDEPSSYWVGFESLVAEEESSLTQTHLYSVRPDCNTTSSTPSEQITDLEIATLPIRELNKRMKNLPQAEVLQIRKRRRSLRNRDYATNCRRRRAAVKENLLTENQRLQDQLRAANEVLSRAVKERDSYKRKFSELHKAYVTFNRPNVARKW